MVSALHEAGIEVILDVVYNHTGEGGHEGPTLSFRGLDHSGYYRLTDDLRTDYDVTGCGNSVDTAQPGVLQLVADSLRYWVTEMGVDGFRFDLVTTLIRDEHHQVDLHHPFQQLMRNDPVLAGPRSSPSPGTSARTATRSAPSADTGASGTTSSATTSGTSGGATPPASPRWASG